MKKEVEVTRRYGDGSIKEREPNRWLVTVPLARDPVTGKRRRRWFTVSGKRRDAVVALRRALHERDTGAALPPEKITVGAWMTRWLSQHIADGHVGDKTKERYGGIVEKHLNPAIGEIRLQALRPDHISGLKARWQSGQDSTAAAPLSGASVHKHLVVLRQALNAAVKAGLIARNPADAVSAPSVKVRTERRALTEEEIATLLAAAAGTRHDAPIRLTLATGVREGELLGLKWDDINLESGLLEVRRTASYIGGKVTFGVPKTERSRRTIELSATTVQLLRAHRAAQIKHRLQLGPLWCERGMVFPSLVGTPWLARTFYRDFRTLLTKTTIENVASVNWHGLRHTAATQWIRHGVDIFSVSRRLGHASASFTMDVYGHLMKGQQRHAAEALDYLLASP